MYYATAIFIGILLTAMNVLNSRLTLAMAPLPAAVLIHAVGLAAVCLILGLKPEKRPEPAARLPLRLYCGGLVGVGTVLACAVAFSKLGAPMAVALSLLGQTALSSLMDGFGLFGRPRYRLGWLALPGFLAAAAGIVLIGWGGSGNLAYAPAGILAGCLPLVSFVFNSQLGQRVGVFRSVRMNFVTGLSLSALLALAAAALAPGGLAASAGAWLGGARSAGPFLALGGGLMGVAVVAGINVVFPRIPALASTTLLFAGQTLAGLAIAAFGGGGLAPSTVGGALLASAGLALSAGAGKKAA